MSALARLSGWRLVGAASLVVAALCVTVVALYGTGEEGVRVGTRATARLSMLLFSAAFVASAVQRRWPSAAGRWLVRNRPYLGFSFGVSHAAHAAFLVALFRSYAPFDLAGSAGGLLGYAFLVALLATSNDASRRALGRGWKRLHTVGMYWLWFSFTFTMVSSLAREPGVVKAGFAALGLGALGLRLFAARGARRVAAPEMAGSG